MLELVLGSVGTAAASGATTDATEQADVDGIEWVGNASFACWGDIDANLAVSARVEALRSDVDTGWDSDKGEEARALAGEGGGGWVDGVGGDANKGEGEAMFAKATEDEERLEKV
jgi:hypothetical protein